MKTANVASVRKQIINEIKTVKTKGILSLSLVGSFQYAKTLSNVVDVDLIILIKKLTPTVYRELNREFRGIAKRLSTETHVYNVENRIAAFKPKPIPKKIAIQLHILIYDIPIWNGGHRASIFDWSTFNKKILGKPLKSFLTFKKLTREDLREEFDKQLTAIKTKTAGGRVHKIINEKLVSGRVFIKLNRKENDGRNIYSVIISYVNFLRYYKPKTKKDDTHLLKMSIKLPKEQRDTIHWVISLKNRLKTGKNLSIAESRRLTQESESFVNYLKESIL